MQRGMVQHARQKSVMTRRPTFETPGRTAENPRSRGFSHSEPAAAGLRQHRTILRVESRRPVFWQVKQKAQRILCVFASIFVTVAGKSASEATLKASAVNCAVLPWMKKGFPTPFWRHSPRGLHFAAQRCMALPPPAFPRILLLLLCLFRQSDAAPEARRDCFGLCRWRCGRATPRRFLRAV